MKNNIKLIIFIWIILAQSASAYVLSKTKSGLQIKWPAGFTDQEIFFNPANNQGVSETTLHNIANSSAAQWNFTSAVSLTKSSTAGTNQDGLNELFFTDDPNIFNSSNIGVAGITLVSYQELDGKILEADVLVNENRTIVTNINNPEYIGNIFTHEFGHFFGLDHSQVIGSTMFYALSLGQNQISPDDKAGIFSIYDNNNSAVKSITGKVVGSKNLYGIFGAQVEAISQKTGLTMGAAITNTDGSFSIDGLPVGDKYFLYTKPAVKSKLPSRYSTVKDNFCEGGKPYRGSFFQACGGGNEGYPQAINLINANVDVGKITVRCSLDVPPDYFQKKSTADADFILLNSATNGVGNAFVGFFSNQEIASGSASDSFKIDLSSISNSSWNSYDIGDLYLEIQVITQSFYSPLKANLSITQNSVTTTMPSKYVLNSDGWIDINTVARVAIDKTTAANNVFELSINPEKFSSLVTPSGIPATIAYILPDYSNFTDELYFYLVNVHLVKSSGDGTYSNVSSRSYVTSDNSSCADANNTYELTTYTTSGDQNSERKNALTCGTIDTNNQDPTNGPFGMIVGFSIAMIIFTLKKKLRFI